MKSNYLVAFLLFTGLSLHGQVAPQSLAKKQKLHPPVRPNTKSSVVERDANSRVWEHTTYELMPSGELIPHVHRYTELATGMNYQQGNRWVESKEEIELVPTGGAAAVHGQHQVYFPYDIFDGVLEIVTPDDKHLKSRPLAISYFDGTNSVLIAEIKNSIGQLVSSNQVIYTNAFTDFDADLLCTYRRSGFECDLVFRSQPSAPEAFGLDSANTRLELLTEFFDTPDPEQIESKQSAIPLHRTANASGSQAPVATPSVTDTALKFGSMAMIHGKAFSINVDDATASARAVQPGRNQAATSSEPQGEIPVAKTWAKLQSRTLLIEEVPVSSIAPRLQRLPAVGAITASTSTASALRKVSSSRLLPPQRIVQATTNNAQFAKAKMDLLPGVVLDYNIVNNQTSMTFRGDMTYYVSDLIYLYGNNVIEGGTVIKYETNLTSVINISGTVECHTGPYHPAVLTSVDDWSVGEGIGSSSASCTGGLDLQVDNFTGEDLTVYVHDDSGYYFVNGDVVPVGESSVFGLTAGMGQHFVFDAFDTDGTEYYEDFWPSRQASYIGAYYDPYSGYATDYSETGSPFCEPSAPSSTALSLGYGGSLNDLIIRYVGTGIYSSGECSVTNLEFVQCQTAFNTDFGSLYAGNVLVSGSSVVFGGEHFNVQAEHLTCDNGTDVAYSTSGASSVTLVNSLITGIPNWGNTTVNTDHTYKLPSSSGIYQTVGAASYYLAENSPYTNSTTTSINPSLLASLRQKTVHPPTVYNDTTITTSMEFGPKVLRDTNTLAVGFHYNALDYCFGGVTVISNITFDAGTAVGYFETANSYGIALNNHSTNTFNGTLASPCVFARYSTVQEGNGNWTTKGWLAGISTVGNSSYVAQINANFTHCYALVWDPNHFRDFYAQLNVHANNCEFNSGSMAGYWLGIFATNCLFDRVAWVGTQEQGPGLSMRNCTMHGGNVFAVHSWTLYWPVWIENCAFDGSGIDMDDNSGGNTNITYCDYNAFLNGAQRLVRNGIHDLVVPSFTWQAGPLGNWYQPSTSPLIDQGSLSADFIALHHFTTQTNQMIEGNSPVDMGYHYVALGPDGKPPTTGVQGIPDYQLDSILPQVAITAPANNSSFSTTRVNVTGTFTDPYLKQITVNGVTAFTSGSTFEALNVPLVAGANTVTATIEDLVGKTSTASITITGSSTPVDAVQLAATPVAGFDPLNVTFTVTASVPGTIQQVSYDFDGNGVYESSPNNLNPVTHSYSAGQYFPVVTIQTTVGRFSSQGGWNSTDPNRLRISVQAPPTVVGTPISITDPVDLKCDAAGNLYVLSRSTATIKEYNSAGTTVLRSISSIGSTPRGLDVDSAGNVYVAVSGDNQVLKFNPTTSSFQLDTTFGTSGHIGKSDKSTGTGNGEFNAPFDVAISPDGSEIAVSDSGNNRIQRFSINGGFISSFGQLGAGTGEFNAPKGLTYDGIGRLYIVDSGNNRLVLAHGPDFLGTIGSVGSALGQFQGPVNLGLGASGIYVGDSGNNRIEIFDLPDFGFNARLALANQFTPALSQPSAVSAFADLLQEKLYIADTGNNRVLLVQLPTDTPEGVWNAMKQRLLANDIAGAIPYFASSAGEDYRQLYLAFSASELNTMIFQIPAISPIFIEGDEAQYYFQQPIDGVTITFPINFVKENGLWKILEY